MSDFKCNTFFFCFSPILGQFSNLSFFYDFRNKTERERENEKQKSTENTLSLDKLLQFSLAALILFALFLSADVVVFEVFNCVVSFCNSAVHRIKSWVVFYVVLFPKYVLCFICLPKYICNF